MRARRRWRRLRARRLPSTCASEARHGVSVVGDACGACPPPCGRAPPPLIYPSGRPQNVALLARKPRRRCRAWAVKPADHHDEKRARQGQVRRWHAQARRRVEDRGARTRAPCAATGKAGAWRRRAERRRWRSRRAASTRAERAAACAAPASASMAYHSSPKSSPAARAGARRKHLHPPRTTLTCTATGRRSSAEAQAPEPLGLFVERSSQTTMADEPRREGTEASAIFGRRRRLTIEARPSVQGRRHGRCVTGVQHRPVGVRAARRRAA